MESTIYHYQIDGKGAGELKVEKILRGAEFEKYKYIDLHLSERDKDRYFIQKGLVNNAELLNYEIDQNQNDKFLYLTNTYSVHDQIRKVGDINAIQLNPSIEFDLESKNLRSSDVLVSYPINKHDSIIYTQLVHYPIDVKLPEDKLLETKYGKYTERYVYNDNNIIVRRIFKLYEGTYNIEEYPAFFDFIEDIKKAQKQSVIILKFN